MIILSILSLRKSFKKALQRTSGFLLDTLLISLSASSSVNEACKRFLSVFTLKSLKGQPPSYVDPLIPACNIVLIFKKENSFSQE